MKNKKQIFIYALMIIAGFIIGWIIFGGPHETSTIKPIAPISEKENTTWTCSMHPQIRQDKPGKCPICAMDLIPINTSENAPEDFGKIQMSENAVKIADVQTSIVNRASSGKEIRLTGKIKADERKIAIITSHFAGRIEKLFVNYTGQQVNKGEKLATIYSPDLVTAQKELFEAAKFKQSNPEYYKSARTKLKLWLLTDEQIDAIGESGEPQYNFDVISHLSGTVLKRSVLLGDHVDEGEMLFEIADLSSIWVLFDAYESDLPWITKGDPVNFEVQSMPGKTFSAPVSFIDPVVNPEARVASIRVETENFDMALKPEMFVRGIIKTKLKGAENSTMIPKSAILWTGKKAIVYVRDKTKTAPTFEYREIVLGEDAGNFYLVKGGLIEGEEIVTNGAFKVDAAAQLEGKKSMMNTMEDVKPSGHQHEEMNQEMLQKDENNPKSVNSKNQKHFSFKVSGNCEMCKERIENAAKSVEGILTADWNVKSKMIEVTLTGSIDVTKVSNAISESGHDTEFEAANSVSYSKLPSCCRYIR